ncbi:MAG: hypothetical protein IT436_10950 [Phycisphaerales bacterium]|nr:hypothetical protein [Phycisphaerales bacterium]
MDSRADGEPPPPGGAGPPPLPAEGVPSDVIWQAITSEPDTGVGIVSIDGQVLYLNKQAAQIYHGPDAGPAEFIGKFWRDLHAPEWVEERLRVLQRVRLTGKPVLMRTIWRGYQLHTWIHYIEAETPEPPDLEGADGAALPERFLTITRRVPSEDGEEPIASGKYELVESKVADLGPLEPLSGRELEVLALVGQGLTLKEIASVLHRSFKTVDNHRQSIGAKLNLEDRVQLAEVARRAGLTLRDADRTRV